MNLGVILIETVSKTRRVNGIDNGMSADDNLSPAAFQNKEIHGNKIEQAKRLARNNEGNVFESKVRKCTKKEGEIKFVKC